MKILLIALLFPVIGMGQTAGELRYDSTKIFVDGMKIEAFGKAIPDTLTRYFIQPLAHSTIKWSSLSAKGKRRIHYLMYHGGEKELWCRYGLEIRCKKQPDQ
jgi:hypothetical protein